MPLAFPADKTCSLCDSLSTREGAAVVAETAHAISVVPEVVRAPGAAVVLPRRHVRSALELNERESGELMSLSHRVARAVERAFEIDGMNFWWDTGLLAGQSQPHLLVEIVPRRAAVPYKYAAWDSLPRTSLAERRELASQLRAHLDLPRAGRS
jgi:histidine triad (HIT) family protein